MSALTLWYQPVMVIERMGRYKTTLKPGLHWIWPIIEQPRRINWRYLDAKVCHKAVPANCASAWCCSCS